MRPRARQIAIHVAACAGLSLDEIFGRCQRADLVRVRRRAMLVAHRLRPEMSAGQLGQVFDRDPSTILRGVRDAKARCERDPEEAALVTGMVSSWRQFTTPAPRRRTAQLDLVEWLESVR